MEQGSTLKEDEIFVELPSNYDNSQNLSVEQAAFTKDGVKNLKKGKVKEKDSFKTPKPKKKTKNELDDTIYTSKYIDDEKKMLAEQVYNPEKRESLYCCWDDRKGDFNYKSEIKNSPPHKPIVAEEVYKGAIQLPTEPLEYESEEKLDQELKKFITTWLDIPSDVLQFAVWNIKRSWVYERFHTLNYLRALGDTGQGKSRFLDTLGYLHYKPINTSGATTSAPVFRIIEKWKGTLVMDEADFQKSDESQDIIKIINQGYERGKHVMRCDRENKNAINFFDPFCPKILATRKTFYDKAVESRCITQVMTGTTRKDIPPNLNKKFFNDALILRNKLLMWRFKNYFKIEPDKKVDFDLGDIEPRVQQIVTSFVSLFSNDKKQLEVFKSFIKNYQEELIDERRSSFAGLVVGGIHDLLESGVIDISAQDIIDIAQITNERGKPIKPRGLTSTLKALGFEKTKLRRIDDRPKRCIPLNPEHLEHLFERYGYVVTVVTVITEQAKTVTFTKISGNEKNGLSHIHRYNRYNVTDLEEFVEPVHHPCATCGANPSHVFGLGKYFCSKDCFGSYKANKVPKKDAEVKG